MKTLTVVIITGLLVEFFTIQHLFVPKYMFEYKKPETLYLYWLLPALPPISSRPWRFSGQYTAGLCPGIGGSSRLCPLTVVFIKVGHFRVPTMIKRLIALHL